MDDFQIADDLTIKKLNEEYQKKLSQSKVRTLSNPSTSFTYSMRTLLNAVEQEKDFLLYLYKRRSSEEVDFSLYLIQQIFENANEILSLIVSPCNYDRNVRPNYYASVFYDANYKILKSVNDLLCENAYPNARKNLEKVIVLQLQIFSIISPLT